MKSDGGVVRLFLSFLLLPFLMLSSMLLPIALLAVTQTALATVAEDENSIGFKKITVDSKQTGEQFPLAVVYPSTSPSKPVSFGPYNMKLAIDGTVANGKFPLVIISHGSGGSHLGHRSIAFALVKQGFAVGMPLHPKNNYIDNEAQGTVNNWINRPRHIHAAIDAIMADKTLSDSIAEDKIAVIGHSVGGYSALVAAGGVADTSHIVKLCVSNPQIDDPFCALARENKIDNVIINESKDERIKALVLMAPVGILFKSDGALNQIDTPVFLLSAEKDTELTEPYHAALIAKRLPSAAVLTKCTIKNAGHYSFITPFPETIKDKLGAKAEDLDGFDRSEFHQMLSMDIVRFFSSAMTVSNTSTFRPILCIEG
jgi:predicted dienelactone hydrolase